MSDKVAQIVVVAALFLLLTWIAVGLRVYCRTFLVRSLGIDDKLMVALLFVFTAYLGMQIYGATRGIGHQDTALSPQGKTESLRLWWVLELLNIVSSCLLKISVGFFLLRIAIDRPHIWIIRTLIAGTVFFGATYLITVVLQCRPISTYWVEGPRTPGKCWPRQVIYVMTIAATVVNTSADFIFGTLSWFIVRSMNLPLGTKIVVVGILGLAAIGSTATVVRAFYIPSLLESNNFLYETTNFAIWSTVEPGIGMIASSIATLRPLHQLIVSKFHNTQSDRNPRRAWLDWRARQQARRDETSRMVRRAHNLDTEIVPGDSLITSPQGIFEVEPRLRENSKDQKSNNGTELTSAATAPPRLTVIDVAVPNSPLRLSEDFQRTMQPPADDEPADIMEHAGRAGPEESIQESALSLFPPQIAWLPPQVSPFSSSWHLRAQSGHRESGSLERPKSERGDSHNITNMDENLCP